MASRVARDARGVEPDLSSIRRRGEPRRLQPGLRSGRPWRLVPAVRDGRVVAVSARSSSGPGPSRRRARTSRGDRRPAYGAPVRGPGIRRGRRRVLLVALPRRSSCPSSREASAGGGDVLRAVGARETRPCDDRRELRLRALFSPPRGGALALSARRSRRFSRTAGRSVSSRRLRRRRLRDARRFAPGSRAAGFSGARLPIAAFIGRWRRPPRRRRRLVRGRLDGAGSFSRRRRQRARVGGPSLPSLVGDGARTQASSSGCSGRWRRYGRSGADARRLCGLGVAVLLRWRRPSTRCLSARRRPSRSAFASRR